MMRVSRMYCFGSVIVCVVAGAFANSTINANTSDYIDGNGYLVYTAQAADESVSFNGGEQIVWGTTFPQNRATFNPLDAESVLTVLNPLVMTKQSDGSRIQVVNGTTVFSGGVTCQGDFVWGDKFLKTGNGVAKFTGAVNTEGKLRFDNSEGTSIFSGENNTHSLADMYVYSSRVIFDNTTINLVNGTHIGCTSGVKSYVYSTNSVVSPLNNKVDFNIGNNGGDALYVMNGGELNVGNSLLLGRATGSSVVFTNYGGDITVSHRLYVAANDSEDKENSRDGGEATLVLDGGSEMKVLQGNVYLAIASGFAKMEILNGSVTSGGAKFYFGYNDDMASRSFMRIGENGSFHRESKAVETWLSFGHGRGNLAKIELNGGSFYCANAGTMFGRKGVFRGEITGGSMTLEDTEVSFGRFAPGRGYLDMFGGTFTMNGKEGNIIGWGGSSDSGIVTGVVSVAGNALFSAPKGVVLAAGASATSGAYGEINLAENGIFETTAITSSSEFGQRRITADGGTFRVLGSNQTVTYLDSVNLETYVGRRGVTFDTQDNTATVVDFASDGKSPGQIRKAGTGTLVLGKLPQTHGGVAVQGGTLRLASGATLGADYVPDAKKVEAGGNVYPADATDALVGANYLMHRWSFNGRSCYDSVAAAKATVHGNIDVGVIGEKENLIETPYGNDVKTFLDLGSGLFGTEEGDFTVEFWANWKGGGDGKLMTIGMINNSSTELYINVHGQSLSRVNGSNGFPDRTNIQLGAPDANKMYHYSIVFKRRTDGRYDTTITRRNLESGENHSRVYLEGALFSPVANADSFCFGATPAHSGESTRPLEIDEVRIWKAALSDEQLVKNILLGPDELPLLNMDNSTGPLEVASGATFDLGENEISYGALTGGGTITNGTLTVETLEVKGEMRLDANVKVTDEIVFGENDSIVTSGTLDLSGATVRYTSQVPTNVRKILVSTTGDGSIVGPIAASEFEHNRGIIAMTQNSLVVYRPGFGIIIR